MTVVEKKAAHRGRLFRFWRRNLRCGARSDGRCPDPTHVAGSSECEGNKDSTFWLRTHIMSDLIKNPLRGEVALKRHQKSVDADNYQNS